ncbi:porin [Paraburkholderia sp.]|uniref:porin n=1 Tax=Paraburkholderia sp. TaxID=1926495 RepID=UPI003C7CB7D7
MLAAVSVPASAQSNVTLYGIVDTGVAYVSKVAHSATVETVDGADLPSLFGMTGTEDLGGGTSAIFKLENGFSPSKGTQRNPTVFFDRQAYVGFSNPVYGTLTMGHMTSLEFDMISPLHSAGWTAGSLFLFHPGNFDDLYDSHSLDSSIKYRSPVFKGLQLGLMYGGLTGGQPGDAAYARAYQAVATYQIGGFSASAFYGSENHRPLMVLGMTGATTLFGRPLTAAPFVTDNVKNIAAGLRYASGGFIYAALFTQTRISYHGQRSNVENYDLSASWQATPFLTLAAGFNQMHFVGNVTNTGGLTLNYQLSKSTGLYAAEVFQRAADGYSADITGVSPAGSRSQNVFMVGMHHLF